MLLRESQAQPLLLVFEDLHWIDTETQALLDRLVEGLPTARSLLLVNYRPEYQHGWGSKTYYTQLRLDPLPPASADEVLQALLGEDPSLEPLKRLLDRRAPKGNPFFLEESVRTLVETGVLVGERGAYRAGTGAADTFRCPATVQAVLAARIDRLPPEEQAPAADRCSHRDGRALRRCLQAIAEMPDETLHRGLAHLQAAEFLYETGLFPELGIHLQARADPRGGLRGARPGATARAPRAGSCEALERLVRRPLGRAGGTAGPPCPAGRGLGQSSGVLPAGGGEGHGAVGLPGGRGYLEQALGALAHLPETARHT